MNAVLGLLLLATVIYEIQAACDLGDDLIELTSWEGNFSSPGLAQNQYPDHQKCEWQIRVSRGSRVKLTFLMFDLEDGYYKNSPPLPGEEMLCNDVVKIVADGKVVWEGCQSQGDNKTFESLGNSMSLYFMSDESTERTGFTAHYEGICDSDISNSGFLESPGYPNPPPDDVMCRWNVSSPQKEIIYIRSDENSTVHALPDCGNDILHWKTTMQISGVLPRDQELCRGDSKIVSQSDVLITYRANKTNNWTGRLYLDYTRKSGCEQYCEHGFGCLRAKTQDIGDYKCLCQPPYEKGRNCEIYTDPCQTENCSGMGQCVTSQYGAYFTCDCQPGYSGKRCEVQLDPCRNLTCLNGGTCIKDNATLAHCLCMAGFKPPVCQAPPNPCLSGPCQHAGTCMKTGIASFVCICLPEYTGTLCTILAGEAHCTAEQDTVVGSEISWADTLAGYHDDQPCPAGITGTAKRNCIQDELSPTRGLWRRPDLSNCVSPLVLQLSHDAQVLRNTGVDGDILYNVTRHLDNVTSVLKESSQELYPGDLLGVTNVLKDISMGVINALSVDQDPPGLAQHFTSTIGNILHPATMDVWKNARVHLVENKVTSILTSAQRFAENLVRRQRGSHVIAKSPSSNVTPALLSAGVQNVELLVTEWNDENTSWTSSFAAVQDNTISAQGPQTYITLPPDLLSIARGDGAPDRRVKLYTGRFTSVAPLLSLKECRYTREDESKSTKIVNSDVISAEVLELPESSFSKLKDPVIITFRLTDSRKRQDLENRCVFMNMTAIDPDERWIDEGCYLHDSNSTHVTCHCYHLTNFAVLLDVYGNADDLDEGNAAALSYISYIGGSLSVLACVVVIVVFEYFRLGSDRIRIHEQLALSIIAVQVLFLIGVGRTTTDSSTPLWACKTVAILLHFSLTALFCWMLVEGIHIYVLLVKVFKRGSHLKKYCAIGWGVPFIVVAISVGVFFDKYGGTDLCWLNHELLLVCFVPTVSLVIIINTVILILVIRVMLRSLKSTAKVNTEHQSSIRTSLKASAILLPLLGLTWTLGFLAVDTGDQHVLVYVFTYLFTICNSFQGVLFFVFHCLLNVDVHNAYERRYRQKKRGISSAETNTRKNSDMSTFLADSSPASKSTTKTSLSDIPVANQRPSLKHNRFLMFGNCPTQGVDPTQPSYDTQDLTPAFALSGRQSTGPLSLNRHISPAHGSSSRDASPDVSMTAYDDMQTSDTAQIWRECSFGHEGFDERDPSPAFHRRPSYPSRPHRDVTAFVTSMHDVLVQPIRNAVRFSQTEYE